MTEEEYDKQPEEDLGAAMAAYDELTTVGAREVSSEERGGGGLTPAEFPGILRGLRREGGGKGREGGRLSAR